MDTTPSVSLSNGRVDIFQDSNDGAKKISVSFEKFPNMLSLLKAIDAYLRTKPTTSQTTQTVESTSGTPTEEYNPEDPGFNPNS